MSLDKGFGRTVDTWERKILSDTVTFKILTLRERSQHRCLRDCSRRCREMSRVVGEEGGNRAWVVCHRSAEGGTIEEVCREVR